MHPSADDERDRRHDEDLSTPHDQSALSGSASEPVAFERNIVFNDAVAAASAASSASHAGQQPHSHQQQEFPSNVVITSKYTAWNFLPKNLFEQFLEPANSYFLFVGLLQAIPAISTTAGIPTHYVPLSFILAVSAIRAAYEDYNRHQTDEAEGRKKYLVYDGQRQAFVTKSSADIVVGDVVKMIFGRQDDDPPVGDASGGRVSGGGFVNGRDPSVTYSSSFPADLLMLSSSHSKGHCFVETASLDGGQIRWR